MTLKLNKETLLQLNLIESYSVAGGDSDTSGGFTCPHKPHSVTKSICAPMGCDTWQKTSRECF